VAVIARPGASSRRVETAAVAETLARYRRLERIRPPATMDGGDVLVAGRRVFVGATSRTNEHAISQLRVLLRPYGYEIVRVAVDGCLHLKSAATQIGDRLLLVNRAWLREDPFEGFDTVDVDPREPGAANALAIGGGIVCSSAYPRTSRRLEQMGLTVWPIESGELAKAEGALTCCSLIVEAS
jgi:dimethylargininase